MDVARDNAKELFLLTLPSLHCHLQKAWLPKGSERGRLKGPPLRSTVWLVSFKKLGGLKKSFEDLKCQNGVMNFPY